jgi:transcriptional regulator with XRE-family HTH domain
VLRVSNKRPWPHKEFSAYLTELCTAAGITHDAELARRANITPSLISRWRSGMHQPSRDNLRPIAETLGVKPVLLWISAGLADPDEMNMERPSFDVLPAQVRSLVAMLSDPKLPPAEREQLLSLVDLLVVGARARLDARSVKGAKGRADVNRSA